MPTFKALISNISAIFRYRSYGYETQNELHPEHQAFIFGFEHHLKTTSQL